MQDESILNCKIEIKAEAYLYKNSIQAVSEGNHLQSIVLTEGQMHTDPFGTQEIIKNEALIQIHLYSIKSNSVISLEFQGCDEKGICYPVQNYEFSIEKEIVNNSISPLENSNQLFSKNDSLPLILGLCLVFGALLNLTPCVLPMLSIYSYTILGSKYISFMHSLKHNLAYLFGLCLTYGFLGIVFSKFGVLAHGFLQHPITIICIAMLLIIFALNCMGLFNLALPNRLNARLEKIIYKQKNGTLKKALIFGALSAIIATPCTSAPLAGALLYIIQTNDEIKGSLMFFAIGLGMGLPLFFIGLFGSNFVNKLRNFSKYIHQLFAIPLILTAFIISKHLFSDFSYYLNAIVIAFCVGYAVFILFSGFKKLQYILTLTFTLMAMSLSLSLEDKPLELPFTTITKLEELNDYKGQRVLLSFSADWCANCHILDKEIYSTDEFKKLFSEYKLLRVDFTESNSVDNKEFANKFKLIGVPTLLLLDENLNIKDYRVGEFELETLISNL